MSLNNFNQRNYQCKFSASELNEMHLPVDSALCLAQITVMHETLDAKCKSNCKMIFSLKGKISEIMTSKALECRARTFTSQPALTHVHLQLYGGY